MLAEPRGPDTDAVQFAIDVEPLRVEVSAVLDAESAENGLGYKDRGISMREGGSWIATVWRNGDGGDTLEVTCTRGVGTRWQVAMVPLTAERPMYVLNWPSKNFQSMLRAAVSDLGT